MAAKFFNQGRINYGNCNLLLIGVAKTHAENRGGLMSIIPIILSGGRGMRLWPLSRNNKPKQFLELANLASGRTLFEQTLLRCRRRIFDCRPIVVGARDHRFIIGEALNEFGTKADVILEPVSQNTCAAIAVACLHAQKRAANPLVMVMAADHDVEDAASFAQAVEKAAPAARNGKLVTFGVMPDSPNPHYGYLAPGNADGECFSISRFVEKPSTAQAEKFLEEGYLWNSGNFLFEAGAVLEQIGLYQPDVLASAEAAIRDCETGPDFIRLSEEAYGACSPVSFDHGVLEKTNRAVTLPVFYKWTDVGNWDGFASLAATDERGNSVFGEFINRDSKNNVVHSEGRFTALLGIENLVVVSTADAVLVADRNRGEEVRELVNEMLLLDHRTLESRQSIRPWGSFEQLDLGEGFQVKRLIVKPGAELSLQKHTRRAEHWVVVKGVAEVTVNDCSAIYRPDGAVHIPKGMVHRLSNPGNDELVVIEVQTGEYLGEDDLVRLDDIYDRHCLATQSKDPSGPAPMVAEPATNS